MKFIHLVFDNIGGQSKTVDFTGNKLHGCTHIDGVDTSLLSDALSLALFGAQGIFSSVAIPSQIELQFASGDITYKLIRIFEQPEGATEPNELAVLTDAEESAIFAESAEAVTKFVTDNLFVSKEAFLDAFALDAKAVATAMLGDATTRETFIAQKVNEVTTIDEFQQKTELLKSREAELIAHIDSIAPVTKKEIKEHQVVVDADVLSLDSVRQQIAEVQTAIAKADDYDKNLKEYYDAVVYYNKLGEKVADVDAMDNGIQRSKEASTLKAIYTQYQEKQAEITELKTQLDELKKEYAVVALKAEKGAQSETDYGQKFIYQNEKRAELDKQMLALLDEASKNPSVLKIEDNINKYYADFDQKLVELNATKKSLDEQIAALSDDCDKILARKLELRVPTAYREAVVSDATVEKLITGYNTQIADVEKQIDDKMREQSDLYDENNKQREVIRKYQDQYVKLDEALKNGHESRRDAEDAVVLYSQTLYAKHIIANGYVVEIKAINSKLEKIAKTTANFKDKCEVIKRSKAELEAHIAKLQTKYDFLKAKFDEYVSFNSLRDYSDDIEYGSHCPICDGFVTYKKDLPRKDVALIQEQMDIVKKEINKDSAAIQEADIALSQYEANFTTSAQYTESLVATKNQKQACIDETLGEYKVASVEELFQLTKDAAKDYRTFFRTLNEFHEVDAELRKLQEQNKIIVAKYDDVASVQLPALKEKHAALVKEATELSAEHDKLQAFCNEESAIDLLAKIQIVDKEYEALEYELEAKQAQLKDLTAKRDELASDIDMLTYRLVPVEYNGAELSYREVVVQTVARLFNAIIAQINETEAEKELIKVRLNGLRKVIADTKTKAADLNGKIIELDTRIAATSKVATDVYAQYQDRIAAAGIDSEESLNAMIIEDETLASQEKEVAAFREEYNSAKINMELLQKDVDANKVYSESLADNKKALANVEEDEKKAVEALLISSADHKDMIERYEDKQSSKQQLAKLQTTLNATGLLASSISDGAIIAKDFARIIVEAADKKLKLWTSDKYALELSAEGELFFINAAKGKIIKEGKGNKEEKALLSTSLTMAYNDAICALAVTDVAPVVTVGAEETDKANLSVLLRAADDKEIFVIPEDKDNFYKVVSKLA